MAQETGVKLEIRCRPAEKIGERESLGKVRKEREQMQRETITKWDAWALVTQNTIAGQYFNDLDEEELWEKLLEMPPANEKAEAAEAGEGPGGLRIVEVEDAVGRRARSFDGEAGLAPGFWARGGPMAACKGFKGCKTCGDPERGLHEWCPVVGPAEWYETPKPISYRCAHCKKQVETTRYEKATSPHYMLRCPECGKVSVMEEKQTGGTK